MNSDNKTLGVILVVDDDNSSRLVHRAILTTHYAVVLAASGEEALAWCQQQQPDLILMDAEMPGIDGYETSRQLRKWLSVPIIFVTAHTEIQEHIKALDAGGDDIITKPVEREILLRKVANAIRTKHKTEELLRERDSLYGMAMNLLSSMGDNGVLLNFMRHAVSCLSYVELAKKLVDALSELGLTACVLFRHNDSETLLTPKGEATELEKSVMQNSAQLGRIFQFKKRLVVNYDRVSILVYDLPIADDEKAGRCRDSVAILAEASEGLIQVVDLRQDAMVRVEQMQIALTEAVNSTHALRSKNYHMMTDVRLLLQDLMEDVEKTYSWLGISESQEAIIKATMEKSVEKLLNLLTDSNFDQEFNQVIESLKGTGTSNDIELF